ncbi:hypothetical protein GCM10020331_029510 [Ectobacillus funiculus]
MKKAGKISLSLKAIQEPSLSKRQTVLCVPKPDAAGFNTLRDKLTEWIEQSQEHNAVK